jgi:AcrR family transcriptional regulator
MEPDRNVAGGTAGGSRDRLLDGAVAYVAEHGVADVSLRRLAAALGTSHRMLIYHFGSKEGLLVEVVRAVEARQRDAMAELARVSGGSVGEVIRRMWRGLTDPRVAPHERLFFELYGQALQGRPHAAPLLEGIVDLWLEPGTALAVEHGVAPEDARASARLGLAVVRGLLLDLLATGDRAACDAAMERFIALYEGSTFWTTSNSSSAEP